MNQKKNIYPSRRIRGISFFTTEQLVKILDLSILTIRDYLKKDKIKAVKVGQRWYVSSKNLNKFLNGD